MRRIIRKKRFVLINLIAAIMITLSSPIKCYAEPISMATFAISVAKAAAANVIGGMISKFFQSNNATPVELSQKSLDEIRKIVATEVKIALDSAFFKENYFNLKSDLDVINDRVNLYSSTYDANPNDSRLSLYANDIEQKCLAVMKNKLFNKNYFKEFWTMSDTYIMISSIRIGAMKDLKYPSSYIKQIANESANWLVDAQETKKIYDDRFTVSYDIPIDIRVRTDVYPSTTPKYENKTFYLARVYDTIAKQYYNIDANENIIKKFLSNRYEQDVIAEIENINNGAYTKIKELKDVYCNYYSEIIDNYRNIKVN